MRTKFGELRSTNGENRTVGLSHWRNFILPVSFRRGIVFGRLSRENFVHFPSLALPAFPIANFNWTIRSLLSLICPSLLTLLSLQLVCLRLCNKITSLVSFVCLLHNWRQKYANDFANDLSRWPADYLEPAQLSQWHWSELNITSHVPSKSFHPFNGRAAITLGFATHSSSC